MVGTALVKAIYTLPTWTRSARLIAEDAALREAGGGAPSQWACYRFAAKLREHGDMLTACLRVRRLPGVRLHVNLTILAQLADAAVRAGIAEQAG